MSNNNIEQIKELRARTSLSMTECKKAIEKTSGNIDAAIDLLKQWGALKSKEKESRIAAEGIVLASTSNYEHGPIAGIIEVNCSTDFVAKSDEFIKFAKSFLHNIVRAYRPDDGESIALDEWHKELIAKTGENIVCRRNQYFDFNAELTGNNHYIQEYNHPGNKLATLVVFEVSDPAIKNNKLFTELTMNVAMQVAAMSPLVANAFQLTGDQINRQQKIFEGQLAELNKPEAAWPKIIEGKFAKWKSEVVLLNQEDVVNTSAKQTIDQAIDNISKTLNSKIDIVNFIRYEVGEGQTKVKEDLGEEVNKLITQ